MLTSSGILFAPPLGRKAWDRQKAPLPKLGECVASLPRKRSCPASATARHPEASGRAPPSRVRPGLALELPPREGRKRASKSREAPYHENANQDTSASNEAVAGVPATFDRGRSRGTTSNPAIEQGGCPGRGSRTRGEARGRPLNNYRHPKFPLASRTSRLISSRCRPSIADRAVPSAAAPAATAASLATRFSFDVLGRLDFFDFVGRLVFVRLRSLRLRGDTP